MSEWISVKDRLPLFGQQILVVSAGVTSAGWYQRASDGCQSGRFERCSGYETHNVTHWQPLPDPPPQKWTKDEAIKMAIGLIECAAKIADNPLGEEPNPMLHFAEEITYRGKAVLPKLREALDG